LRANKKDEFVLSLALGGSKTEHHTLSRDGNGNFRMDNAPLSAKVCPTPVNK
jgi:hypothetical protein